MKKRRESKERGVKAKFIKIRDGIAGPDSIELGLFFLNCT
jgi:hypothetical protein